MPPLIVRSDVSPYIIGFPPLVSPVRSGCRESTHHAGRGGRRSHTHAHEGRGERSRAGTAPPSSCPLTQRERAVQIQFHPPPPRIPAPADLIVTVHSNFVGSFCKVRRRRPRPTWMLPPVAFFRGPNMRSCPRNTGQKKCDFLSNSNSRFFLSQWECDSSTVSPWFNRMCRSFAFLRLRSSLTGK